MNFEALTKPHKFGNSIEWKLTPLGITYDGVTPRTPGEPVTVRKIWSKYGAFCEDYAEKHKIPVELIIATIAVESKGDATAIRFEPGYESDDKTPNKVSPGLMQTLLSTARTSMRNAHLTRAALFEPEISIAAGTSFMASQASITGLDPPKVAAAYNAGALYADAGVGNRWKMRCYPLGTGRHCDSFVEWFNDTMFVLKDKSDLTSMSFTCLFRGQDAQQPPDTSAPDPSESAAPSLWDRFLAWLSW